jgi:ADP-heptose:LPS heptosyltransferase
MNPGLQRKNSMPHDPVKGRTSNYNKIAIFRALQLGDMLCIIPTVRALRCAFPMAKVSLIGLAWQSDFVRRFSNYFDEFIEFSGWPGLPERTWDAETSLSFVSEMQQRKFDLVLQMQGNGILTNSMCLLWKGGLTAGLKKASEAAPGEGIFIDSEDDEDHEILRFMKLLAPFGISHAGTSLEFNFLQGESDQFRDAAKTLGIRENNYVCIHPGARDPKRRWPVENFASIARALYNEGFKIVITGSTQEVEIMDQLQREAKVPTIHSIREAGEIGLGLLAGFIAHSAMLISNDTGVSHMASALNVPSVIIFSAYSSQQRWAPLDQDRHIAISHSQANDVITVVDRCLNHLRLNAKVFSQSETSR